MELLTDGVALTFLSLCTITVSDSSLVTSFMFVRIDCVVVTLLFPCSTTVFDKSLRFSCMTSLSFSCMSVVSVSVTLPWISRLIVTFCSSILFDRSVTMFSSLRFFFCSMLKSGFLGGFWYLYPDL